jgi:hypothetical protein
MHFECVGDIRRGTLHVLGGAAHGIGRDPNIFCADQMNMIQRRPPLSCRVAIPPGEATNSSFALLPDPAFPPDLTLGIGWLPAA